MFQGSGSWSSSYGQIKIDPALDFADFDADKTVLKFKFKVGVDKGPDDKHTLFHIYFNHPSKWDERVGKVGHNGATLEWYNAVVNDNKWHELEIPLKDYVAKMTGVEAATELAFSPLENVAAIGTTIYFKDIRIVQ